MVTSSKASDQQVFRIEKPPLDEINLRLLAELQHDPRLRTTELARRLGVSAPTELDPAALGLPVAAWVRLRPGPGQNQRIVELAGRTPQVVECHRISGEDCFLIRLQVDSIGGLESVLDQFVVLGQTTSSFIVSTPVEPRSVPLPAP
jgi:Lrp/AsnC family leucine-responsive transcriptional regulator